LHPALHLALQLALFSFCATEDHVA
jgi:hypothetical protein